MLAALGYVALVAMLSVVRMGGEPLIGRVVPLVQPGGRGFTLERFREADRSGPVDILFIGPSQCYRSFDPRWFNEKGFTSMNLGSTAQCPITSLPLIQKYLDQLKPKLVVMVVSQHALAGDALESQADLASNLPIDRHVFDMTLATQDITAVTVALSAAVRNRLHPLAQAKQQVLLPDVYVPGGFVDTTREFEDHHLPPHMKLDLRDDQRRGQERCLAEFRLRKMPCVTVAMPITPETRAKIDNYAANHATITAWMQSLSVPYTDLNFVLDLKTSEHFYDELHLDRDGVRLANEALLAWLQSLHLLPTKP